MDITVPDRNPVCFSAGRTLQATPRRNEMGLTSTATRWQEKSGRLQAATYLMQAASVPKGVGEATDVGSRLSPSTGALINALAGAASGKRPVLRHTAHARHAGPWRHSWRRRRR